jgi:hypothetical protein
LDKGSGVGPWTLPVEYLRLSISNVVPASLYTFLAVSILWTVTLKGTIANCSIFDLTVLVFGYPPKHTSKKEVQIVKYVPDFEPF